MLFGSTGCALCHNPQFKTRGIPQEAITDPNKEIGPHVVALRGQDVNLYSDLLLHHMGAALADNFIQGKATQDEFRTTPLWGIGQRLFFPHDGRTNTCSPRSRITSRQPVPMVATIRPRTRSRDLPRPTP